MPTSRIVDQTETTILYFGDASEVSTRSWTLVSPLPRRFQNPVCSADIARTGGFGASSGSGRLDNFGRAQVEQGQRRHLGFVELSLADDERDLAS